jgi:hypothetical protein
LSFEYMICPGTMKAGTTLLYELLRPHPQLRMGRVKEIHYFYEEYDPRKPEFDALFADVPGVKVDMTTLYMYDPPSLDRICKIIDPASCAMVVLLRDPIERALSHYRLRRERGLETMSLEESFPIEPERIKRSPRALRLFSYFSRGLYAKQLDELYARFPAENILILLFEDFVAHQQETVDRVTAFLGLDPIKITPSVSNAAKGRVRSKGLDRIVRALTNLLPDSMKTGFARRIRNALLRINHVEELREEIPAGFLDTLKEYYREDVERLRKDYGVDTSKWKHFGGSQD